MRLTFLGTRGNIDIRSRRHRRHTATLVSYRGAKVLLDCGADWLGRLEELSSTAVVLTHAHSDHVGGLKRGTSCPVYATDEVWQAIHSWGLRTPRRLQHRERVRIGRLQFEAFPVVHSVRAPAVGYRITAGAVALFYVPDVLDIPDRREALGGIRLYVGDGATIVRPLVRRRGSEATGHASVSMQLDWCAQEDVRRAIFTHCGTPVVSKGPEAERRVAALAAARGVKARVAYDGLELVVR